MITSLSLNNFKSFDDQNLKVGKFTIIVGTNASGKSNIRDAFRFLHGIGRGYTIAEIIGGKYGAGGQVEWGQLRGTAPEIIRFGAESFSIEIDFQLNGKKGNYLIKIEEQEKLRGGFRVVRESLKYNWNTIYTSHPSGDDPVSAQDDDAHLLLRMAKSGDQRKYGNRIAVRPDQPALSQIKDFKNVIKQHKETADLLITFLSSMRFLDLIPDQMRKPAFPGQTTLGDNGENLPTVLQDICADDKKRAALADWVRELTPMDVESFEFPHDQITGLVHLVIRERDNKKLSAYSASDGTLRFLAMLAALLGNNPAHIYFFEEIDNGMHPSRLRLLLDLIENQTRKQNIQVVTTTHSPDLLSMVSDSTFETTSVVFRNPDVDSSIIRLVSDLPRIRELRKSQGLGRLHASGWFEDALIFDSIG